MCIASQIKDPILSGDESPTMKKEEKVQKLYQLVIHKKKKV